METDLKAIHEADERQARRDVRKHDIGEANLAGRMTGAFIRGMHSEDKKITEGELAAALDDWMAHTFGCQCDGDGV